MLIFDVIPHGNSRTILSWYIPHSPIPPSSNHPLHRRGWPGMVRNAHLISLRKEHDMHIASNLMWKDRDKNVHDKMTWS